MSSLTTKTNNYMVPASGGTHAVMMDDTFTASPTLYDFRQYTLDNYPFIPQGAYVDNTANAQPAIFVFAPMGLTVSVPAYAFAVFNFPAPKGLQVSCTGNGDVKTIFVDYPVLPMVWYASSGQTLNIPANPATAPGYSAIVKPSPGFEALNVSLAPGATSANQTPANQGYVRRVEIDLEGNAAQAAAGANTITVKVNGITVWSAVIYIPAAAPANPLPVAYSKTLNFDNIAPATMAGNITVTLANALTSGTLNATAYVDA